MLNFNSTNVNPLNNGNRAIARAVRCVQHLPGCFLQCESQLKENGGKEQSERSPKDRITTRIYHGKSSAPAPVIALYRNNCLRTILETSVKASRRKIKENNR